MTRVLTVWLVLIVSALSSCSPEKPQRPLEIGITPNSFSVRGVEYTSKGEFVAALKVLEPPTAVGLTQAPGTKPERLAEAIAAVKEAGITAPVAIVGNEVFYK